MITMLRCSLVLLVISAVAQEAPGPGPATTRDRRWAAFEVGSYVKLKRSITRDGKEVDSASYTHEIVGISDKEISIKSNEDPKNPKVFTITRSKGAATKPKEDALKEVLTVGDKAFRCSVMEDDIGNGFITKTWWCESAPGRIVQRVATTPDGSYKTRLLSAEEEIEVGGEKLKCWKVEEAPDNAALAKKTIWYSDRVPGYVVKEISTGKDDKGALLVTTTQVLEYKVSK